MNPFARGVAVGSRAFSNVTRNISKLNPMNKLKNSSASALKSEGGSIFRFIFVHLIIWKCSAPVLKSCLCSLFSSFQCSLFELPITGSDHFRYQVCNKRCSFNHCIKHRFCVKHLQNAINFWYDYFYFLITCKISRAIDLQYGMKKKFLYRDSEISESR